MKAAIVYNKDDHKLKASAYSWSYRSMFLALAERLDAAPINSDCSAQDIGADVIIFFDPHSSHHINIDGIASHRAVKMEFFNDPHQEDFYGKYADGTPVIKLGAEKRVRRALDRGIEYIISPYKGGYYRYIAPFLGKDDDKMLLHFPISPSPDNFIKGEIPIAERKGEILANGCTWSGHYPCYIFRNWAFKQNGVTYVEHCHRDKSTPGGGNYGDLLAEYAGALALMEFYPVPKYFEIPMAGCVCFAQYHKEYEELGFRDGENCFYVDKNNFKERIDSLKANPASYQHVADAGRKLVLRKYTARHFASYIYKFAESVTQYDTVGV